MTARGTGRRTFLTALGATALAGAGGAAATTAATAATPAEATVGEGSRFRIGYQIFGWSRYFPSAWWKGAAAVGALGFRGIEGEYTIAELYEGRESEFDEGMARCGVQLAAFYSSSDLEKKAHAYENTRKNVGAARFLERSGARMLVIGGMENHERTAQMYTDWCAAANELGRRTLEGHGVRLGFHPHYGALVESREHIGRVMEGTDPRYVFLAPDTGHLLAGGADAVEVFRTYKDRIAHAHLKDWAPAPTPGRRGTFAPLGKGAIDFPALLRILAPTRFDGWLDVELDNSAGQTPEEVARGARAYLENILKEFPASGGAAATSRGGRQ